MCLVLILSCTGNQVCFFSRSQNSIQTAFFHNLTSRGVALNTPSTDGSSKVVIGIFSRCLLGFFLSDQNTLAALSCDSTVEAVVMPRDPFDQLKIPPRPM